MGANKCGICTAFWSLLGLPILWTSGNSYCTRDNQTFHMGTLIFSPWLQVYSNRGRHYCFLSLGVVKWLTYCIFHAQIHWFSIFNSFMMVIFLTGLVSMILMRTLRNDYAKYAREDDDLESLVSSESEIWSISACLYICYFYFCIS